MKYIMLRKETKLMGHLCPIIFPSNLVHADVAEAMIRLLNEKYLGKHLDCFWNVRSAGEFNLMGGEAMCAGRSSTLNLNAHDRDSGVVLMADYGGLFE